MKPRIPVPCSYMEIPEKDRRPIREDFWYKAQSALRAAEDYSGLTCLLGSTAARKSLEDRARLAAKNLERYYYRRATSCYLGVGEGDFHGMDSRAEQVRVWIVNQSESNTCPTSTP